MSNICVQRLCPCAQQDKYDLYRLLGAGGFGMVLLVRRTTNGNYFACKIVDKRIVISQNQVRV